MRADYDSKANAIAIGLVERAEQAERADQVHARGIVSLKGDAAIEVELLYPDLGIEEPLRAAAERHNLDAEALIAAAQAALAAPDRPVTLEVAARVAA
jgi:hypothetical protein